MSGLPNTSFRSHSPLSINGSLSRVHVFMTPYPKHHHQSKGEKLTNSGKNRVSWFLAEAIGPDLGTRPGRLTRISLSESHLKVKNTEAIRIHVFCHRDESFITFIYLENHNISRPMAAQLIYRILQALVLRISKPQLYPQVSYVLDVYLHLIFLELKHSLFCLIHSTWILVTCNQA